MNNTVRDLILSIGFFKGVFITGILPFWIIYRVSDLTAWVLRVLFGYRVKMVKMNLVGSDLKLHPAQLNQMIRKIYSNLADVVIEGFKGFTLNERQLYLRHKVLNPEVLDTFFTQGRSVILVSGHIANWEWGSFSAKLYARHQIYGLYKPLNNSIVDKYLRKSRSRHGVTLVPVSETRNLFEAHQTTPAIYVMIADQSPTNPDKSFWIKFLGRETAFLHGPEKYARQFNYPVVFADIERLKRGYYTVTLSVISENPTNLPPGELTRRYAEKLENGIRKSPDKWLWTHKRWKLRKPM